MSTPQSVYRRLGVVQKCFSFPEKCDNNHPLSMQNGPELWIGKTAEDVASEAVQRIKNILLDRVALSGTCSFVLSGGTTPVRLFQLLARDAQIPWAAVSIWWVDERWVPLDHPDANFTVAYQQLLSRVPVPVGQIFAVDTARSPQESIFRYEQLLREHFSQQGPDVILLGMGADGHTASLFPGNPVLASDTDALCVFVEDAPKPPYQRITWTPRAINKASHVIVMATGAEKASALSAAIESDALPQEIPIRAIHPREGRITWLVDQLAAAALRAF